MARRIYLVPGTYRAETEVTVFLLLGETEKEYMTYPAGSTFTVPSHANGYYHAAVYHPDFGDERPRFKLTTAASV